MNKKFNYPLCSSTWDAEEIQSIDDVIKSGFYTMSNNVIDFEKNFSAWVGSKYAIFVNSGSSANLLMIAALIYSKIEEKSLRRGDEIIVPAVSWITTYSPLQQFGLKLKFVDIDLNTLNYDLDKLISSVSDKTKAIFCVNLLGNPNQYNVISNLAIEKNILIIEDNCESLGATLNGKHAGTFGIMGSFSTFFSHHICTIEGGVVVTDDEYLSNMVKSLRAHGWTRDLSNKNFLNSNSNNFSDSDNDNFYQSFDFILPGYNLRPTEISGSIGLSQLKKINRFLEQRRKNADVFRKLFRDNPYILIQEEIGSSSWFGFSLIIKNNKKFNRKKLINFFIANNIEHRPIVSGNFLRSRAIDYFNYSVHGELENANYLHDNGLFIGNHHIDMTKSIEYLHKILKVEFNL